jgi:integrase
MASIRRHPARPDNWQVRYYDPGGRQRTRNFSKKSDADKFTKLIEADKLRGVYIDPGLGRVTLAEWADLWLTTRTHLKPKTLEGYRSLLRTQVLPRFGGTRLDRIERLDVEAWLSEMTAVGLSPSRTRQAHQVLNALLKAAVRSRYVAVNPAEGVSLPRLPQREQLFLSPDQVERLVNTIRAPYGTLVYVLAVAGLRWGEAAALRRGRIDIPRSRLEVIESLANVNGALHFGSTKSHKARSVVVPAFLRDVLNEHLTGVPADPAALVFTSPEGQPMRSANFARTVWKPAVAAAGLPEGLRIHDLRHTAAALMVAQGAHPEAVKRHLGHSSITVTMDTYGHLFPSEAEALADRINDMFRSNVDTMWTHGTDSVVPLHP